jgi:hemoglobin-like flavoprotein
MTPEQVKLVQNSFVKVEAIAETAADLFYDRLFEIAPAVRPLFPDDLAEQKVKLMDMLGTAVNNLHQIETIVPAVEELGRKHVGYGVTSEHYDQVGAALLWTLEKGLADDFTAPVKEAWTETYGTLAGVMKEAAAAMPPPEKKGFFARMFGT